EGWLNSLAHLGQADAVEAKQRDLLARMSKALGIEHPDALLCRHNLVYSLLCQDRYAEAEKILGELIPALARVRGGRDHPDVLACENNLGWALAGQGKAAEAEAHYRGLLERFRKVRGTDHRETLIVEEGWLHSLARRGEPERAERQQLDLI